MSSLIRNATIGYWHKKWALSETLAYLLKGISRELKIAPDDFAARYVRIRHQDFLKKWLVEDGNISYFNIMGAKLPDVSKEKHLMEFIINECFEDVFLIPAFYNENYSRSVVTKLDKYLKQGTYCYTDEAFEVSVKNGDVVIDAGAWIGDFSAYAVSKGALVYAFEPTKETFNWLCETVKLNDGKMKAVHRGLSSCDKEAIIYTEKGGVANSMMFKINSEVETITLTSLDRFVEENNIERIDFIKADIEGAERDMLRGAVNVLKNFAPKLAICTYHFPEDPKLLEKIIKEANPDYQVIHMRHILFAAVKNK